MSRTRLVDLVGLGLGLLLALGLAGLGALDLAWGKDGTGAPRPPSAAKVDALLEKAYRAGERGQWAEAERLYARARTLRLDGAELAERHAVALARIGRSQEALAALEEAARLGYALAYDPKQDPALDVLRANPRFVAALAAVERNMAAAKARIAAAKAPIPSPPGDAFGSLEALRSRFDREERDLYREHTGWESQQIASALLLMRRIAALERYAAEHPRAKDRAETEIEALRAWAERTGFSLPWRPELASDLAARAGPLVARSAEARFYSVASRVCAGDPGQEPEGLITPPAATRCQATLGDLAALAADGQAGPWAARAAALQGACLHALRPEDREAFLGARAAWLASGLQELKEQQPLRYLDGVLDRLVIAASLRVLGPPEIALTSSDGKTVTLASLGGKVVLLDFWSPG